MDVLELPLLRPTDSIKLAMDYMQTANARAIVVGSGQPAGGDYVLQMNKAVMKGYELNQQFLYQLAPGIPLPDLSQHSAVRALEKNRYSFGMFEEVKKVMDSQKTSYGFASSGNQGVPTATIVTRHEGYSAQIKSANKVCVCDGPQHHTGDDPPLYDGEDCLDCEHKYICR
jgi:hypothetical protein